jgi:hypothetical protein
MKYNDEEMEGFAFRFTPTADVLALRLLLRTELEVRLSQDPSLAQKLRCFTPTYNAIDAWMWGIVQE